MTGKKTRMKDKIPRKERKLRGSEKKEERKKESSTKDYARHRNKVIKNDTIVNKGQAKSQYTIKKPSPMALPQKGHKYKIKETTSLINLVIK